MPSVQRSAIKTILLNIKAWLVEQEVVDASCILLTARPWKDVAHFMGDQDVILKPGRLLSLGYEDGSGRTDKRVKRMLDVGLRSRDELDMADEDRLWLTKDDAHFDFEERLADALELYDGHDTEGNLLLIEPMRLASGDAPERLVKAKGWGISVLQFELVYAMNLDQLRQ